MKYQLNKRVFNVFPELESERLNYRQIRLQDSRALFAIRSNKSVMQYMGIEAMNTIAESEELIRSIDTSFKSGAGINWGIIEKSSDRFMGYFGFWRLDYTHCRGEIGYALHPDFQGKGFMHEAGRKLSEFGFRVLKLHSIEANVNPDNIPSIQLLEKIGFRKEGYFRENYLFQNRFEDSVIFSLLESDIKSAKVHR